MAGVLKLVGGVAVSLRRLDEVVLVELVRRMHLVIFEAFLDVQTHLHAVVECFVLFFVRHTLRFVAVEELGVTCRRLLLIGHEQGFYVGALVLC